MNYIKQHPKLYVMDNGRMKMDKNFMIAMHNPATADKPNRPNEFIEFPIYTILIDHPEGLILFDTACNPNAMGEKGRWSSTVQKTFPLDMPESCYLHHRLEELGFSPQDIKFVVASHLHLDHAGCLELFTNATIVVQEDEFNGALQVYAKKIKEGAYIWDDIEQWIKNDLNWHVIKRNEDNINLADGIEILNLGSGHAWGLLGLHITMPDIGRIILASDAIYSAENMMPTIRPPGIIYDTLGYISTVERLKRLAAVTNSQIWYGHDAAQFDGLRKSTEGYYE